MNVVLTINISLGLSALLTFVAGGLLVALFWRIQHQRRMVPIKKLRTAVRRIIYDQRRNSLLESILSRAEKGKKAALNDFWLIDRVVRTAFVVIGEPELTGTIWFNKFHKRALEAAKVIREQEKREKAAIKPEDAAESK